MAPKRCHMIFVANRESPVHTDTRFRQPGWSVVDVPTAPESADAAILQLLQEGESPCAFQENMKEKELVAYGCRDSETSSSLSVPTLVLSSSIRVLVSTDKHLIDLACQYAQNYTHTYLIVVCPPSRFPSAYKNNGRIVFINARKNPAAAATISEAQLDYIRDKHMDTPVDPKRAPRYTPDDPRTVIIDADQSDALATGMSIAATAHAITYDARALLARYASRQPGTVDRTRPVRF